MRAVCILPFEPHTIFPISIIRSAGSTAAPGACALLFVRGAGLREHFLSMEYEERQGEGS